MKVREGYISFIWATRIGIGNRLSVGFNLVYLFGTLEKDRSLSFPDSVHDVEYTYFKYYRVSDLKLKTGLQYYHNFNDDYRLNNGIEYSPEMRINIRDKEFAYTYFEGNSGIDNKGYTHQFAR
jgi:hypothetical protein